MRVLTRGRAEGEGPITRRRIQSSVTEAPGGRPAHVVASVSGANALAVRPRPALARRTLSPRAIVLSLLAALAGAMGAGYAIGHGGGPSIAASKRAGVEAGQAAGLRAGGARGFRAGFDGGRGSVYRDAYRDAYRRALGEAAR